MVLERVVTINCQNIQALKWTPLQKEALWNGIWKTTADDFDKAIHDEDLQAAHALALASRSTSWAWTWAA